MAVSVEVRPGTAERILDAAFDAVLDFGLSRTTVEDVAQRAGLSRQTVYRYFPSKDALIVALVSREEEQFIEGVREAIGAHQDLGPAIADGIRFVLGFARRHPLLDRLLATDPQAFLPYLTTRGLPVIVRAREAMLELLAPRAPHLPLDALRGALDASTRAIVSYVLTPSERPDDVVAADVAAMVMATLRHPELEPEPAPAPSDADHGPTERRSRP